MERRVRALTPDDIVNFPLKQAVRGYSVRQVDDLLDRVADEFERIHHELAETRQRLAQADARVEALSEAESTLKRTLVTAQRAAEQTVAEARERAATVVEQAQEEAERKHHAAVSGAREQLDELRRGQRELVARIEALKVFDRDYRSALRDFAERHLRSLDELEQRVPPSPPELEVAARDTVPESQRTEEATGDATAAAAPAARDEQTTARQAAGKQQGPPKRFKLEEGPPSSESVAAQAGEEETTRAPRETSGSLSARSAQQSSLLASRREGDGRQVRGVTEGEGGPSHRWPVVDLSRGDHLRWRVDAAFGQLHQGSNAHEEEKEEDLAVIDTLVREEEDGESIVVIHQDARRRGVEMGEAGRDGEDA